MIRCRKSKWNLTVFNIHWKYTKEVLLPSWEIYLNIIPGMWELEGKDDMVGCQLLLGSFGIIKSVDLLTRALSARPKPRFCVFSSRLVNAFGCQILHWSIRTWRVNGCQNCKEKQGHTCRTADIAELSCGHVLDDGPRHVGRDQKLLIFTPKPLIFSWKWKKLSQIFLEFVCFG